MDNCYIHTAEVWIWVSACLNRCVPGTSLLGTPGICKVISLKNGRWRRDMSQHAWNVVGENARAARNNNRYATIIIVISRIMLHRENTRGINNYEITRGHKVYNKTRLHGAILHASLVYFNLGQMKFLHELCWTNATLINGKRYSSLAERE